jgi:hypothetical protein
MQAVIASMQEQLIINSDSEDDEDQEAEENEESTKKIINIEEEFYDHGEPKCQILKIFLIHYKPYYVLIQNPQSKCSVHT